MFNASKSQLLHFTKSNTQEKITLEMNNNKIIEATDKCVHLGIPLLACTLNNDKSSTVRDLNRRVNNLLADFSFVDSNTLSVLYLILTVCLYIINYYYYKIRHEAKTAYSQNTIKSFCHMVKCLQ